MSVQRPADGPPVGGARTTRPSSAARPTNGPCVAASPGRPDLLADRVGVDGLATCPSRERRARRRRRRAGGTGRGRRRWRRSAPRGAAPSAGRPGSPCRPSPCRWRGVRRPDRAGDDVAVVDADLERQAGGRRRRSPRTARSSRPSSSACARGTPLTRITLPPSSSRSVARNVTSSSSAATWTAVEQLVEGGGDGVRAVRGEERVDALEPEEGDCGDPVLEVDVAGAEVLADDARARTASIASAGTAAPRPRRRRDAPVRRRHRSRRPPVGTRPGGRGRELRAPSRG